MQILEAIVHHIAKAANSDIVEEFPRPETSPVDARMTKLAEEVLVIYSRVSNMYGSFDPDPVYLFEPSLKEYYDDRILVSATSPSTTISNPISPTSGTPRRR